MRHVFNPAGYSTYGADYDPYGNTYATYGIDPTSLGYTGEFTDASGLTFLRARYLHPRTGTFLTRDPFEGVMDMSISRNGYSYAHANPVNHTDPSGRFIGAIIAVIAAARLIAGAKAGAITGAVVGGGLAEAYYRAAKAGLCGCDLENDAKSMSHSELTQWRLKNVIFGLMFGGLVGAIAGGASVLFPQATLLAGAGIGLILGARELFNGIVNFFEHDQGVCAIAQGFAGLISMLASGRLLWNMWRNRHAPSGQGGGMDETPDNDVPEPGNQNTPQDQHRFTENQDRLRHMFRDEEGHFPVDTPANRRLIQETANDPRNYLGSDRFGNQWYAEILPDGRQIWTTVRNGEIIHAGINTTPQSYNLETGLNAPPR